MSDMSSISAINVPSASSNKAAHIHFSDSESHIKEETSIPTKGPDAEPTGDVASLEPRPTVCATRADPGWGGGTTSTQVSTNLPTVSAAIEAARCPPSSHPEGPPTSHQCGFIVPRETITGNDTAPSQEPSASRRTTTGEGPPQFVISKPVPTSEDGYRESVTHILTNPYTTPDVTTRDFAPTSDSPPVTSVHTTFRDVPSSSVSIESVQTPDLANIDRVARGPDSIDTVFESPVSSSGDTLPTVSPGITRASPISEPFSTLHHTEPSISESSASRSATVYRDDTPPKGWTPKPGPGMPDIKRHPLENQPFATVGPSGTRPEQLMPEIAEKPTGCDRSPSSTPNSAPSTSNVTSNYKPSGDISIKAATAATTLPVADNAPFLPLSAEASTTSSPAPAATWETSSAVVTSMIPTPVTDPVTQSCFTKTSAEIVDSLPTTCAGPTGNVTGGANSSTSPITVIDAPTSAVGAHTPSASSYYIDQGGNEHPPKPTVPPSPTSVTEVPSPLPSSYYIDAGGNEHPPKETTVLSASDVTVTGVPKLTVARASDYTVTGVPKLTITYTGNLTTTEAPSIPDATTVMTITYVDTYDKYKSATPTAPPGDESTAEKSTLTTDVSGSNTKTFTIYRSVDAFPSQTVGDGTSSATPEGLVTALSTTILPSLLPGHSTSTSCIRSSVSATAVGFGDTTSSSSSIVLGTPEIPTSTSPYTWHDPSPFGTLTLSTSTNTDNNPYMFPTVSPVAVMSRMDLGAGVDAAEPAALGAGLGEYERAYGAGVGNAHADAPRDDGQGFGTSLFRIGAQTALWGVLLSSLLSKGGKRYAKEAISVLVAIALVVVQITAVDAAEFPANDMAYAHTAVEESLGEGALLGGLGGFAFALLFIAAAGTYYIKRGVAKTQQDAGIEDEAVEWAKFYAAKDKGSGRRKQ